MPVEYQVSSGKNYIFYIKKEDENSFHSFFSEMISPTMIMETEEAESETSEDTIEEVADDDDKQNIYEEVLNNAPTACKHTENCRNNIWDSTNHSQVRVVF